jgi:DNA-directed RNA polymerase
MQEVPFKKDGTGTQIEIEQTMYLGGMARSTAMMAKAEEQGRAMSTPYAREIVDAYVLPIAEIVRRDLNAKCAGRRQAHAYLLAGQDPEVVAALAVRIAINCIMQDATASHRSVAYAIGKAVHSELVLETIAELLPELFYTLTRDFGRRLSKDERHKLTVFRMQAQKAGIPIPSWDVGSRDQVGLYLLGLLEDSGMITIDPVVFSKGKQAPQTVRLTLELCERIEKVRSYLAITSPVYGPCVEPPLDWTSAIGGGYHTKELRRTHPCLVRHRLARTAYYTEARMPTVLAAANALQRTSWAVNTRMLEIVRAMAETTTTEEIVSLKNIPQPAKPEWLATADADKTTWPEERQAEFKRWKWEMNKWHTARRIAGVKYGRFYNVTRAADMFQYYKKIYFVYFADSRGRFYPMTYGLNPQGSDIQKAMLHFGEGMPVNTPDARKWFLIQGANKWGFDKATLEDREAWHKDKIELLLSFADDPLNNQGWLEADAPLQFLAWCLEFADFYRDTTGSFLSRQPISMDGSCNGLQNLSALLRDEVGGEATNLTKNKSMQDIYRRVAEAATIRMKAATYTEPELEALRLKWLSHGIARKVVKRSVMTTPYGVTKRSAQDYVISDYLAKEEAPCFAREEWQKAAQVLMEHAWPAIGDVVVKGRLAMDWLKSGARKIIKRVDKDEPVITWYSPSGFPAVQAYYEIEIHRINSKLHGPVKIRVPTETDEADVNRHANGLAPNFVHSLDAAHLHLATERAAKEGITHLAMIHDDYGTHAYNAQRLFHIIRESFVDMYEKHDPIQDLRARYPYLPPAPDKGTLDIRTVLESDFFFS